MSNPLSPMTNPLSSIAMCRPLTIVYITCKILQRHIAIDPYRFYDRKLSSFLPRGVHIQNNTRVHLQITVILGSHFGLGLGPPPLSGGGQEDPIRISPKWRARLQSALTLRLITLRKKVAALCPMQNNQRNRLRMFLLAESWYKPVKSAVESPVHGRFNEKELD